MTSALLIDLPEDLPQLDAVITHPFLTGNGDRLVTEEGYHPEERVYLQNRILFSPAPIDRAVGDLDDLFHDFLLRQPNRRPHQPVRRHRHPHLPPFL